MRIFQLCVFENLILFLFFNVVVKRNKMFAENGFFSFFFLFLLLNNCTVGAFGGKWRQK